MYIFTVIAFLLWIIFTQWKSRKILKLSGHTTSQYVALPFFGHAYIIWSPTGRMDFLKKLSKEAIENGGVIGAWFGRKYCTVICDAVILENILKSSLEKADFLNILHDLLGNGSIFARVKIWRLRRKLILPTFSLKNLRRFLPVFFRSSNDLVDRLKPMVDNGSLSILKYLTYYSMESVCETVLGEYLQDDKDQFLNTFQTYCRLSTIRMCNPLLHWSAIYRFQPCYKEYCDSIKVLRNFVDKIIESKRGAQTKISNASKNDRGQERIKSFIDMLVDDSNVNGLTNDELREEILVMTIAGTDTSAIGSSFVCTMLARHFDIQERLYKENNLLTASWSGFRPGYNFLFTFKRTLAGDIANENLKAIFTLILLCIVGSSGLLAKIYYTVGLYTSTTKIYSTFGERSGPFSMEDLSKLKYLDAVIKETLRLYPPVPSITRELEKDTKLPSGITLVKGTWAFLNIWALHRNPRYWGLNAEEFNPDRFINGSPEHPNAFIPFSWGPRNCLGYQYAMWSMKIAVINLVRNYKLLPSTSSPINNDLNLTLDVMLRDPDGFQLRLEKRHY